MEAEADYDDDDEEEEEKGDGVEGETEYDDYVDAADADDDDKKGKNTRGKEKMPVPAISQECWGRQSNDSLVKRKCWDRIYPGNSTQPTEVRKEAASFNQS